MPANPLYTLFMADLRRYDQLTLILAGLALLAVLIGWSMLTKRTPVWQRNLYFCFLLFVFILSLAGTTVLIVRGGTP